MLFNSVDFALFLPLVFAIYWLIGANRRQGQNVLLIAASYLFYGWWDWRFLFLIAGSSLVDYFIGLAMQRSSEHSRRRSLMILSLVVNLGLLGFFKYYNFFLDQFVEAFSFFGGSFSASRLDIILPVGISFYTFQTLSYSLDVYKKKISACRDLPAYLAYVSFFPQLVAGPIERASNLLPQFLTKRNFNYTNAVDGLRQILWGLFKKMLVADHCAEHANYIFNNSADQSGGTLILGAVFFAFQIYGDFSGYSDIAIGTARVFGFNLMQNFAFPYFSRDIAEFWRRWHISLSSWFKDYLYIPLGGSRGGIKLSIRNIFIIFLVSGFWHGANWTFIVWGGLNALYFLPGFMAKRNRKYLDVVALNKRLPSLNEFSNVLLTFIITVFAWIFFRAENVSHAIGYIFGIFTNGILDLTYLVATKPKVALIFVSFMLLVEWNSRTRLHGLEKIGFKWPRYMRWGFYSVLIFAIGMYAQTEESPFIYFQF